MDKTEEVKDLPIFSEIDNNQKDEKIESKKRNLLPLLITFILAIIISIIFYFITKDKINSLYSNGSFNITSYDNKYNLGK